MHEQTQKIRELLNKPIIRDTLSQEKALWAQRSSCLDVIGDTELAIDAYLNSDFEGNAGIGYLAVYGLLQVLYVQQYAVKHLCESLGMPNPIEKYPRLVEIREIRNDTIGHPTKRDRRKGQPTSYHFISRPALKPDGFQLLSFSSDGIPRFKNVSIPDSIRDQRTCLSEILTSVISELEQKEKIHKGKFKMEKLASFFPPTLDYAFEKVREGTMATENTPIGTVGLSIITKALQDFREALSERGVTYEVVDDLCEQLEYPLAELEAFFQNVQNGKGININEKTAYIFAFFVEKKVKWLKNRAQDIDKDYSM